MNKDNIIIVHIWFMSWINHIWDHSTIKNITKKKSLSVFIFAVISNLIGEKDSVIHATKAHISIENPKWWNNQATIKHHHIANSSKNSWDLAMFFINLGNTYIHIITAVKINTNHFNIHTDNAHNIFSHTPREETNINNIAATISCTIKNHIAILPYIDHVSHLSDINFMIIMVLLNVMAIAI